MINNGMGSQVFSFALLQYLHPWFCDSLEAMVVGII